MDVRNVCNVCNVCNVYLKGSRPVPPAPLLGGLVVWWLGGVSVYVCGGSKVRWFDGLLA